MKTENSGTPWRVGNALGQHPLLAFPPDCRRFYQTGSVVPEGFWISG